MVVTMVLKGNLAQASRGMPSDSGWCVLRCGACLKQAGCNIGLLLLQSLSMLGLPVWTWRLGVGRFVTRND